MFASRPSGAVSPRRTSGSGFTGNDGTKDNLPAIPNPKHPFQSGNDLIDDIDRLHGELSERDAGASQKAAGWTEEDLTKLIELTKAELEKARAKERDSRLYIIGEALDPELPNSGDYAREKILRLILGEPLSWEQLNNFRDIDEVNRLERQQNDLQRALDAYPPASFLGFPFE
jgi:hypothetical protein